MQILNYPKQKSPHPYPSLSIPLHPSMIKYNNLLLYRNYKKIVVHCQICYFISFPSSAVANTVSKSGKYRSLDIWRFWTKCLIIASWWCCRVPTTDKIMFLFYEQPFSNNVWNGCFWMSLKRLVAIYQSNHYIAIIFQSTLISLLICAIIKHINHNRKLPTNVFYWYKMKVMPTQHIAKPF